MARVFSQTLGSTLEGHPAVVSVAWLRRVGKAPSGEGPGRAVVDEAHRQKSAQIERSAAVV